MSMKRTSVISSTRSNNRPQDREVSEFDGGYLNIGVNATIDGETRFIRLPLGVYLTDLSKRKRKIYKTTIENNPERAAELQLENDMIDQLCERFRTMEEGEGIEIDSFTVQLYRKNEEIDEGDAQVDAPTFDLFAKA